jgi:hypothetical protein
VLQHPPSQPQRLEASNMGSRKEKIIRAASAKPSGRKERPAGGDSQFPRVSYAGTEAWLSSCAIQIESSGAHGSWMGRAEASTGMHLHKTDANLACGKRNAACLSHTTTTSMRIRGPCPARAVSSTRTSGMSGGGAQPEVAHACWHTQTDANLEMFFSLPACIGVVCLCVLTLCESSCKLCAFVRQPCVNQDASCVPLFVDLV